MVSLTGFGIGIMVASLRETRLGSLPHPKFDHKYLKVCQVYTLVNVLKFGSVCHLATAVSWDFFRESTSSPILNGAL